MYISLHVTKCFIRVNRPAYLQKHRTHPGTGRCYYIQRQAGARTMCDHAMLNIARCPGEFKIADDLKIAEIVRRQFYLRH